MQIDDIIFKIVFLDELFFVIVLFSFFFFGGCCFPTVSHKKPPVYKIYMMAVQKVE